MGILAGKLQRCNSRRLRGVEAAVPELRGAAPHRPASLIDRIEQVAGDGASITFVGSAASSGELESVSWAHMLDDARAMAAALQRRGVAPGAHIAILGPTTRALVTAVEATWLCGA